MNEQDNNSAYQQAKNHLNGVTELEQAIRTIHVMDIENEALRGLLVTLRSAINLGMTDGEKEQLLAAIDFLTNDDGEIDLSA